MNVRRTLLACASISVLGGLAVGESAYAQTAAGPQQAAQAATLEEVVVTARKRDESLQQIPLAVTSTTGAQLDKQGVRQTTDLARIVPSLSIAQSASANTAAVFSLRGQAPGDILLTLSQPVGVYEDTVNVPHPDGLQGAFFDIQRVEVVKGPQGTLYGRNTTGGAVNIITRNADFNGVHGFVNGEVGNYDDWKLGGAVNVPIVKDMLSVRLAYQHWNREGYGHSITSGQHLGDPHNDDIFRMSLRFDPTSTLTSTTKLEYGHLKDTGFMQTLVAIPTGAIAPALEAGIETRCGASIPALIACGSQALSPFLHSDPFTNGARAFDSDVKTWHAVEDISWDITDTVRLRSITGFHSVYDLQNTDLDATPFQILEVGAGAEGGIQPIAPFPAYPYARTPENNYKSTTQEFDLTGHAFGHLDWLVGAYGSWEHGRGGEPFIAFGAVTGGEVNSTTSSIGAKTSTWALFTQNDLHLTDRVSVTFGARYTEERQSNLARPFTWALGTFSCAPFPRPDGTGGTPFPAPGNNPDACPTSGDLGFPTSERGSGTSYLLSYNYQITPDTLFYAKTARGFRGGALQFRGPQFPPVHPEIAVDYEMGFKSDFFERRLRTNLALYQTNYSNKQETQIVPVGGLPTTVLFNAANARIRGFEAEVTAVPVEGLSTYGTFTYLEGQYLHFPAAQTPEGVAFDASGLSFSDPRIRYSLGARYEHPVGPGIAAGQLDWAWHAHTKLTELTTDVLFNQAQLADLNRSVGLLNARLDYRLPDRGLTMALFATNLLDKHYQVAGLFSGALGIGTAATQEPRMFGVSLTKTFGSE